MTQTFRTGSDASFRFKPFSKRQKIVLTWWTPSSPFHECDGIICDGSIRSGKSLSMSMSFVMWAMETFNECNFGMCGKTVGSLRRNVINDLKRVLKVRGYVVEDKRSEGCLRISRNGRTNQFYLFGGTNEASQDLIQGITLAGILLDEAALMPESFVNQATSRCSVEGAKIWFNCNPAGSQLHWFKRLWINKYREKRLLYLHFTMDDNLSLSEKTKARYRGKYIGVFYRRYIEGLWVAAEGLIYSEFSMENNTYEKLDEEIRRRCLSYVTVDYGTANPCVFLHVLYDQKERVIYIDREYYYDSREKQRQKSDAEYGDDMKAFAAPEDVTGGVVIDPSALSLRVVLKDHGYRVRQADNDVINGIREVSSLMSRGKLKVNKSCEYTIKEFFTYSWDEKSAESGTEKPIKQNDHACDAIRYFVRTIIKKRTMLR